MTYRPIPGDHATLTFPDHLYPEDGAQGRRFLTGTEVVVVGVDGIWVDVRHTDADGRGWIGTKPFKALDYGRD